MKIVLYQVSLQDLKETLPNRSRQDLVTIELNVGRQTPLLALIPILLKSVGRDDAKIRS